MPSRMAVPRNQLQIESASTGGPASPARNGTDMAIGGKKVPTHKKKLSRLEAVVVQLYSQGVERRLIARLLVKHLCPPNGQLSAAQRYRLAKRRLKQLEERKWFRDAVWKQALQDADLETPAIVAGLVRKAKRGRVDASKLVLGLTGRYTEAAEQQATTVNIVFGAEVPRPANRGIDSQRGAEEVDAEDGDWEELVD